jgi:spermidine dehydrogenase
MSTKQDDDPLGIDREITRRDFIGSTLLGAGAALLGSPCPAAAQGLGQSWTGFGGVGDYRFSNGNTAQVVRSAHRIRDGAYDQDLRNAIDTGENYDAVIIGAGFAGMTALYEFKKARPHGTCLMLDNHSIFGGEAKQNEFDVDGYRLVGPQGSNEFLVPKPGEDEEWFGSQPYDLWRELELPNHFEFAKREAGNSSIVFDKENFFAMYSDALATVGYFFQNEMTNRKGVWVKNIWDDDLRRAPLPEQLKKDLIAWRDYKSPYQRAYRRDAPEEWGPWLDSMTRAEFVTKVAGLNPDVLRYDDPGIAAGMFGGASDGLSAYALAGTPWIGMRDKRTVDFFKSGMGFPGGNTTLLRHFVKAVFPAAIMGPKRFDAIANNRVNFAALDSGHSPLRMRLSATAVNVAHEGPPSSADHVDVVYEKGGQLYRVKAKGAVLAIGSWVAKHIASDVPADYQDALGRIPHGPILSVNVALHNWRFLERLGVSAARWFEGFGFFANIRQPMLVGDRPTPFHPDKPALLTFYVPFLRPGLPIEAQGPAGRAELYGTSYADFEKLILAQMQRLFSGAGFNARRDIAGIVLNRWGHALFSPPPGFFFGKDGKPSHLKVLREAFGRIAFGHSELNGTSQAWETAAAEGRRAMTQILNVI